MGRETALAEGGDQVLTKALDRLLRPEATAYAQTLTDLAHADDTGDETEAEAEQIAS